MDSLELRNKLVARVAEACRAIKRPDAAQALEYRTEEEWAACGTPGRTRIEDHRLPASAACDLLANWAHSPEGHAYWFNVKAQLSAYERKLRTTRGGVA
jgi:hypothetical protein